MIDLHTHSACSDGTDPPARVVELAAAAGCSALALTDHDTLVGLPAARSRAAALGVTLVAGCEVSCAFRSRSAHVLVYFAEGPDGPLHEELARLRQDRMARNRRLADRLRALGLDVTYEEIVAEAASEESAGRPHVAAVLVRHGYAESIPDAFDRWLGGGAPAYVPKARLDPAALTAVARRSGAVTVLAHPLTLGMDPAGLEQAVGELAEAGFAGIEAYYARYPSETRRDLAALAERHGLVATGGSDYHGEVKAGLSVGTGEGDLEVPDEVLDALAARRA
jgi:3',5'-nucleoside bisphosphate phosphatase